MSTRDTHAGPGRLYGVGLGPGDPSLMTVRAVEVIEGADVVAYHSAGHGRSIARTIAARYLRADHVEEPLVYPVTTGTTDHPGGYRGALDAFYEQAAERLAAHLEAGRSVALLAEGDPMFYGSYMHMHKRLADRYPTEVVPGVTSVSAAAARLGTPLVEGEEVLTVLPGTLPGEELAARLAATDAAVVMKLGRTFTTVRSAFGAAGRLADAHYVERATMAGERTAPLADVDPASVPYFSVAVLPSGRTAPPRRPDLPAAAEPAAAGEAVAEPGVAEPAVAGAAVADGRPAQPAPVGPAPGGEVVVVGTGPAGPLWMTPQTRGALAAAQDLVGYTTYLDRVPERPGQARHGSDNRVEAERAEFALELARRGRRVAVVSGGDPGVFAMATAVLEAAAQDPYRDVPVRVLPGVTAANAAAARAGAPLGHDYAALSLSDRLKPWDVIAARLTAAASADLVLALYNPGSRSRTRQVGRARDILLEHRAPDTPVVVARDVGGPEERVRVVPLAALDPSDVDMRTLLIVGSSQTRTRVLPTPSAGDGSGGGRGASGADAAAGTGAGGASPAEGGAQAARGGAGGASPAEGGAQEAVVVWTPRTYPDAPARPATPTTGTAHGTRAGQQTDAAHAPGAAGIPAPSEPPR